MVMVIVLVLVQMQMQMQMLMAVLAPVHAQVPGAWRQALQPRG